MLNTFREKFGVVLVISQTDRSERFFLQSGSSSNASIGGNCGADFGGRPVPFLFCG
jgi:hypothetical protein